VGCFETFVSLKRKIDMSTERFENLREDVARRHGLGVGRHDERVRGHLATGRDDTELRARTTLFLAVLGAAPLRLFCVAIRIVPN
jgi:hypothetical protein